MRLFSGWKQTTEMQRSQCVGEAVRSWGFPPEGTAERVPRLEATGAAQREESRERLCNGILQEFSGYLL